MKYLVILFFLWLVSCSDVKQPQEGIIDLTSEVEISPDILSRDIVMTPPVQMLVDSDFLIFMAPGMGHSILFLDKNTQKTYHWGQMGNGPDDFISPKCIRQKDHMLTVYDVNLRKAVEYEIHLSDSVHLNPIKRQTVQTDSINLIDLHIMDNNLTVGLVGIGCPNMFVLLDDEMKFMKSFGDFPMEGLPKDNYLNVYGSLASYKNKLFYACLPTGYIACYNIDRKGNIQKDWEHFLTKPSFDTGRGKWTLDNKNGIYDIKTTQDYVFLAFSGKSLSEESRVPQNVLIFTHEGKLVKNIKCKDSFIGRFVIDGDYIYASGVDNLIKFNWRKLL